MDLGLSGKTVMITGGSGGIGRGLVLEFAREGANVVSVDRDPGDHLVAECKRQGLSGSVLPVQADITDRASVDAMLATVHEKLGPIDILVNNAGGGAHSGPTDQLTDKARKWEIAINIDGVVNCTLAVGDDMRSRGKGAIVNISSNAALSAHASYQVVHYGAVKGFVNTFSKGLAWEWAKDGVRINTIAPGWIIPHKNEHITGPNSWWNKPNLAGLGKPEDLQGAMERGELDDKGAIPIPRLGRPEDIAHLAMFLASDKSSYLTGQLISVSGGGYMP